MLNRTLWIATCLTTVVACGSSTPDDDGDGGGTTTMTEPEPTGLPVLGNYTHEVTNVALAQVSTPTDGLSIPRDLAFNPFANELWVVNRADHSGVIYTDPGLPTQAVKKAAGAENQHFMPQPSGLAFGDNGFMATIHEEHEKTQGPNGTPADFMGPSLWPSDSVEFEAGHLSHYDMLHNSPDGMGIAWQIGNVYWVFDGYHAAITKYDFALDHGPAGTDHSDGIIRRYVEGGVLRVADVPSHMEFHPTLRNLLYVADTGHNRIALLDTNTGAEGANIVPNYDFADQKVVNNATLTTFIDGALHGWVLPSGLAIDGEVMYVTDAETSIIWAFSLEGELLDWLETGMPPRSLCGIAVDATGQLWIADALAGAVKKIAPLLVEE